MSSLGFKPAQALALMGLALIAGGAGAQSVSITSGVPVTQTFDSMAGTQGTTASTLPAGWFLFENGSGANTTYLIDDGTSASGNTFSYGANGQTDRAFGALASGSVVAHIGARMQNDTGATLTEILIEFTGEQWRLGTPGGADKLDFQYCTGTCALSDAANATNWTNFDALDLVAPVTAGTEGSILNGNLAANQVAKSATITGLSIANLGQMWVRWVDTNDAGVDDALAIENFRAGLAVDNPPVVTTTVPATDASGVAVASNLVVTFSEAVNTDPGAFTLSCPPSMNLPLAVSGSGSTRTLDPNADLPFGTLCTATVVAANVNDLDGTPDDMASDYSWSFTTIADNAPTILSTSPASGATGVNVNAVVTINFSEPVATTNPWIALTCNSITYSGSIAASNGGATWTLDPTANFVNGEVCTVQITGANVVDLDGTPQALVGNPSFSFTIAPDLAPSIDSTYPVDLDVNVPAASNLTVVFSEPVTVQPAGFVITCNTSGAHPFARSDVQQREYTLNPNDDFTAGETCTFLIDGDLITDIDGVPNNLSGDVEIEFTIGAGIAGYYERVDASSCRALRATLHGVIDDHSAVAYSDAGNTWTPGDPSTYDVWEVLNIADEDPLDPTKVLDIYRNESYTKIAGGTGIYNREHVWPNSQGFNNLDTLDGFPNSPYTDTHMLMASNTDYNARRGSRLFGTCNPGSTPSCTVDATIANASSGAGGGSTSYTTPTGHNWYTNGQDGSSGRYEVWSFRRGDLARAMLYMDVRYEGGRNSRNFQREPQLILTDTPSQVIITNSYDNPAYSGLLTPILAWHNADPPTAREGIRNAVIESVQGNRNPFVDHPEWANVLFGAGCAGPKIVAVDDDFRATEDTVLSRNSANDIGVLNDDRVFEGSALVVSTTPAVAPLHGSVALSANGQFVYTPTANYCGKDTFTYSVSNDQLTDTAVAHIDITCVNDLPVTVGSIANASVNVGGALKLTTAQAFNDVDGDDLVYSISATPALPASITINAGTGVISGVPVAGDAGVYSVTVRASEPSPLTGFVTQTFTLTINNDAGALFRNGFE